MDEAPECAVKGRSGLFNGIFYCEYLFCCAFYRKKFVNFAYNE